MTNTSEVHINLFIRKMSENLSEELKFKLNLDSDYDDSLENLQDKCGIFGCIANGDWPTNLDVAHIICLGLVGLQHRYAYVYAFRSTSVRLRNLC